jgi:DNA modification methylase
MPVVKRHDLGQATIYEGDVRECLATLPADHFHCVVTSPPYWALRSYLSKDHALKSLELGSEPTPEAYIDKMVAVFRDVRRVLRPDGLCWVDIGDSYAASGGGGPGGKQQTNVGTAGMPHRRAPVSDLKQGDLCLIPSRLALALQADGWYVRQIVVWCLSGGTWLYARTTKGDAPAMLKDLVRLKPNTVQLWNGQRWTRVKSWTRNRPLPDSRDDCLEVELRSGERIGCTAGHYWPTKRGLIRTSDLVVGDVIDSCCTPEPGSQSPYLFVDNADIGWLCGFYLAEGNKTDKGLRLSVHADEERAFRRIRRIAELFDGTAVMHGRGGRSATIDVYSSPLREMVAQYVSGRTSHNKRLTRKCWMRSNTFLSALLDGYVEGDGHWDKKANRWRLGFTNNDGLAVDLRAVSARLGKVCVLRRTEHVCNGKRYPGWRGNIRERSSHHNAESPTKVVALRNGRAREYWDIEVEEEPHVFALASGVLTHNSKPAPMPESVSGTRWERCRVKVVAGGRGGRGLKAIYENGSNNLGPTERDATDAIWQPCPGCDKCRDTGGYVLRRGSWRCTTAHEYVLMLAKSPSYFADQEAVKEEAKNEGAIYITGSGKWGSLGQAIASGRKPSGNAIPGSRIEIHGRNPRSVWTIGPEQLSELHYAAFPSALPEKCINASTSAKGCCPVCGAQVARIVESVSLKRERPNDLTKRTGEDGTGNHCGNTVAGVESRTVGWRPTCDHAEAANPVPCRVLDPFGGSGTTALQSLRMGREATLCELNPAYVKMAERRIRAEFGLLCGPRMERATHV